MEIMEQINISAIPILLIVVAMLLISNIVIVIKYKLLYNRCEKYVLRYYRMKQKFQDILKRKTNRES